MFMPRHETSFRQDALGQKTVPMEVRMRIPLMLLPLCTLGLVAGIVSGCGNTLPIVPKIPPKTTHDPLPAKRSSDSHSSPVRYGPQLEGTITAIHPGSQTTVTLRNVQEALKNNGPFHHHATLTVTLGAGRFVSPGHWRASGDAMDLFIGESIAAVPGAIAKTITGNPHGFPGIVYRIRGSVVTLQKLTFVGNNAQGAAIYRLEPTLTRFHVAPYSRFSWEGNGRESMPYSHLRVGQLVDGLWEGSKAYPIADQWTIFPSAKAFGAILEYPHDKTLQYHRPEHSRRHGRQHSPLNS